MSAEFVETEAAGIAAGVVALFAEHYLVVVFVAPAAVVPRVEVVVVVVVVAGFVVAGPFRWDGRKMSLRECCHLSPPGSVVG